MQHPPRAFYIAVMQRPLNDRKQINIVLNAKVVTAGLVIGWVLIEMRALCLININIPILTIASARHVIFVAFGFAFFLYLYIYVRPNDWYLFACSCACLAFADARYFDGTADGSEPTFVRHQQRRCAHSQARSIYTRSCIYLTPCGWPNSNWAALRVHVHGFHFHSTGKIFSCIIRFICGGNSSRNDCGGEATSFFYYTISIWFDKLLLSR